MTEFLSVRERVGEPRITKWPTIKELASDFSYAAQGYPAWIRRARIFNQKNATNLEFDLGFVEQQGLKEFLGLSSDLAEYFGSPEMRIGINGVGYVIGLNTLEAAREELAVAELDFPTVTPIGVTTPDDGSINFSFKVEAGSEDHRNKTMARYINNIVGPQIMNDVVCPNVLIHLASNKESLWSL